MPHVPGIGGFVGQMEGRYPGPTCELTGTDSSTANNNTSYTFSNVPFPGAVAGRRCIVAIHYAIDSGNQNVNSVTINGSTATKIGSIQTGSTNMRAVYWYSAIVAAGETVTVVVNVGGLIYRMGIAVYKALGLVNSTPTVATNIVQDLNFTINRPEQSIVLAAWSAVISSGSVANWNSPADEQYDLPVETVLGMTGALEPSGPANASFPIQAQHSGRSGTASAAVALAWA